MALSSGSGTGPVPVSGPSDAPGDPRTRFVEHRGRRIVLADFSGMHHPAETVAEVRRMGRLVQSQPPASVLTLTDVRGARYSWTVLAALGEVMRGNAPFVRRAAAVLDAPLRAAFDTVLVTTGRSVRAFESREDALDWLAEWNGEGF